MCEKIISNLVGRELEDINVLDVKPWVMHAEVAQAFLACNNRVILAGDAAHRFPPAGGFGMDFFSYVLLEVNCCHVKILGAFGLCVGLLWVRVR